MILYKILYFLSFINSVYVEVYLIEREMTVFWKRHYIKS